MEKIPIILQSLFILLVVVDVTTACSCAWRPLSAFLCDSHSTVIRARVLRAEVIDRNGNSLPEEPSDEFSFRYYMAMTRYQIQVISTFKAGPFQISTNNSVFEMTAPRADSICGFILARDTDYLLAGSTNDAGEFDTDICQKIERWNRISPSNLNLLEHKSVPDCEYVKKNMSPFYNRA
ncbi:hypothetical protein ACJMK2_014113 [Sinanodonta woodiana]|uniref:NTR domain-containing protein n=1 Tax=Sinanodonta woodiana TaxID=1069815 RepID=A0ABD3V048_SINWO